MNIKQLRYFIAIAENSSISAAAKKLGISQPPLSAQLQLLEKEFGVRLLERGPRSISLTDAGRMLYRRAISIVALSDAAQKDMADYCSGLQGTLRLGTVSSCGTALMSGRLVAFKEALEPSFVEYQKRIIENARALAEALKVKGFILVSGGTDNHMMLVDVKKTLGMTGKQAERILDSVYITCNKNTVPFDTEKPMLASGIRLGTPAITTRGFGTNEVRKVAELIDRALRNSDDEYVLEEIRGEVRKLTSRFPLHGKSI
jgi:glycine/serine hydroxymethyltransferase